VDPALINPRNILAAIAADLSAPPSARVMACKVLLAVRDPAGLKKQSKGKLGKKALAARAASRVGGRGSPWGSDLDWSPGGRGPQ